MKYRFYSSKLSNFIVVSVDIPTYLRLIMLHKIDNWIFHFYFKSITWLPIENLLPFEIATLNICWHVVVNNGEEAIKNIFKLAPNSRVIKFIVPAMTSKAMWTVPSITSIPSSFTFKNFQIFKNGLYNIPDYVIQKSFFKFTISFQIM